MEDKMCKTCKRVRAGDIVFLDYGYYDVIIKIKYFKQRSYTNAHGHTAELHGKFFYSQRNIMSKGIQPKAQLNAFEKIKILKSNTTEKDWNKIKLIYMVL